eukprot:Rhum_TRINITY_DN124_c0_g1::Rhum_TRINITY_DN124_c0_g1_i1::g.369::m.369
MYSHAHVIAKQTTTALHSTVDAAKVTTSDGSVNVSGHRCTWCSHRRASPLLWCSTAATSATTCIAQRNVRFFERRRATGRNSATVDSSIGSLIGRRPHRTTRGLSCSALFGSSLCTCACAKPAAECTVRRTPRPSSLSRPRRQKKTGSCDRAVAALSRSPGSSPGGGSSTALRFSAASTASASSHMLLSTRRSTIRRHPISRSVCQCRRPRSRLRAMRAQPRARSFRQRCRPLRGACGCAECCEWVRCWREADCDWEETVGRRVVLPMVVVARRVSERSAVVAAGARGVHGLLIVFFFLLQRASQARVHTHTPSSCAQ